MKPRFVLLSMLALAGLARAADPPPDSKAASGPARVENRVKETELTTVRLTPEAENRLGIRTTAVTKRQMVRHRTYGGEVIVPPGRSLVLAAPVAGMVVGVAGADEFARVGQSVKHAESVLQLVPGATETGAVLAPGDRISFAKGRADLAASRAEAEGQAQQAQVRLDAARVRLERAEALQREHAASHRTYEDARADFELAQTGLKAAQERRDVLARTLAEFESGRQAAVPITAPFDAVVRTVRVAAGQIVAAGAALLELDALDPVWVRVAIYPGDQRTVAAATEARVRPLGTDSDETPRMAQRVEVPGTADPSAGTVDLYFRLSNEGLKLLPGERVAVSLPGGTAGESAVVPRSAVLYDIAGGTWVYEKTAAQTYVRRRVEVRDVLEGLALLARGPAPGSEIVIQGAVELFGTEFGAGK
jgi:membrane fusion protein, heavy metal efflux system